MRTDIPTTMARSCFRPGSSKLFGPIESCDFARSLPKKEVAARALATDKANQTTSQYTAKNSLIVYSAPAIFFEQIAYNQPTNNSIGMIGTTAAYNVKLYKVFSGWVRKNWEEHIDYGTSMTGITKTTSYTYDNAEHKQLAKKRVTQSDGSIVETVYRYPLAFKDTDGRSKVPASNRFESA